MSRGATEFDPRLKETNEALEWRKEFREAKMELAAAKNNPPGVEKHIKTF